MTDFAEYVADSMSPCPHTAFFRVAGVDVDSGDQPHVRCISYVVTYACRMRRAFPC
jgi:hypothetical protein